MSGVCAQLQQLQTLAGGMHAYTAGVSSAADGAADLLAGLAQLQAGLNTLSGGADSLKNGADQLKTGAQTLRDGTGTLKTGAQELYDGLVRFNAEGLSQLTDSEDLTSLQTLLDVTDAVKAAREGYTSFAGAGENTTGSVKFVMKVAEDKDATNAALAEQAAQTDATESDGGWLANLWARITALFQH